MKEFSFMQERCVGCGACKAACRAEHRRNHTIYDPLTALPMARKLPQSAQRAVPGDMPPYPVRCIHCDDAKCQDACIGGSVGREDRVFGRWALCVGCFMCVMNCPYGAMLPAGDKAVKCDQCLFTAQPACVRACPQGALLFGEPAKGDARARRRPWKDRAPGTMPLLKAIR